MNKLQQERDDLVRLVSSGQEIMDDLMKENEELEHQLTLHVASQKTTLMGDDEPTCSEEQRTDDNPSDGYGTHKAHF